MGVYSFLSNTYVLGLAGFAVGAVCGYYVVKKPMETKLTTKSTWLTPLPDEQLAPNKAFYASQSTACCTGFE